MQKAELYERIRRAGRDFSTATVLLHHAVAEQVGLPATDHKYLDVIVREGPMSAGRLANLTGLTTGAVTGLIDRLEQAGLVRREKDPSDRRKVIIQPRVDEAMRRLGPIFDELGEEMDRLHKKYNKEELAVIVDYLDAATTLMRDLTSGMRGK